MWHIIIKMVAKGKGIWNYINLEMSQELCPILIKSVEPAFSELHANAASYIDLNTMECEVYKFMYQKYKTNYDEYKVLHTAIKTYSAEIVKSVSPSIILYIYMLRSRRERLDTYTCSTPPTSTQD